MAYAVKYYGQFYDRQNQAWRVEILLDGYGGDSQEITLATPPVTFKWSGSEFKYEPIITSSIEVKVVQTSNYQFREFLVNDELDYLIRLKKYNGTNWNTSTIWWTGFLLPDILTEQYTTPPHVLTIRGSDGLSRLKNVYYVSSGNNRRDNFYTGVAPLSEVLCKCLANLRIDLGSGNYTVNTIIDYLNTYENSHTTADSVGRLSPLDQTYVDQAAFIEYKQDDKIAFNCYEVIENICKVFGARLFLSYDDDYNETGVLAWHIKTINDYDGSAINRSGHEVFDGSNYFDLLHQETVTITETISTTVANFASEIIYANSNHEIMATPATSEVMTAWKPKNQADSKYNNIIPSGEFEYNVNPNLSDWNNAASLKNWTISGAGTYSREKNPYKSNNDPYFQNIYGVEMNTANTYLESTAVKVPEGFGGTNLLAMKIRAYYLVPTLNGTNAVTFTEIIDPPRANIKVEIDDGTNVWKLYRTTTGFAWKTGALSAAEELYIRFGGALIDYDKQNTVNGINIYPDSVLEFVVLVPMPNMASPNVGDLTVRLYQADRIGNAGVNERRIQTTGGAVNETVRVVYEFCRANLATQNGDFGNFSIKYISNNSNIRTSAEPIEIDTVIGDPVDGEGFNVGALKLSTGAPTDVWEWNGTVGGTDGETIHKVLMRLVNKNYGGVTINLSGDFNTAHLIQPQKHFQLSDNSVTKDMVLGDFSWDMQEDIANCLFFENKDNNPTIAIEEQHTEDIPSVGATSGGSLASSVPISIDPNIDAG